MGRNGLRSERSGSWNIRERVGRPGREGEERTRGGGPITSDRTMLLSQGAVNYLGGAGSLP